MVRVAGTLLLMAGAGRRQKRQRGSIEELPSGSLRVTVYAGIDPVTKRRHYLREVIPPGPSTRKEADKALRRLAGLVDERRNPRTNATVDQLLDRHFELVGLERSTLATYVGYADKHIRPLIGGVQVGALDADLFDSFYAELRRCREHCDRRPYVEHRTKRPHECDARRRPHSCTSLGASTIRQIHFILSGALKRAVRWRWIATNPIVEAEPPPAPKPSPRPPTAQEAAQILAEAWKDPDWGLLVWVAMVTGLRRGELCGIRWRHVDLTGGVLALERSIGQRSAETWEKDTKTHQHRRIALDPQTVDLLREHRQRCAGRAEALGLEPAKDAFVFSLAPDGSTHLLPDSVSQRYGKLAKRLGIQTSIHKPRHYSATELIAAGVDVRTVAGRLGHGGGGTTTLRVYAAWVSESDQRAAAGLFSRMPARPANGARAEQTITEPRHPYEAVAAALRREMEAGSVTVGEQLPAIKNLAEAHGVSAATAQRAVSLLQTWGYVEVLPGRGVRVLYTDPIDTTDHLPDPASSSNGSPLGEHPRRQLFDLVIRHRGTVVARLTTELDRTNAAELREVMSAAVRRSGGDDADIGEYEMELREAGEDELVTTFVAPVSSCR
ncbi:tyrosine-type recombinase/integrase [Pseudonocardia asaccharolytica]|uniref:tyrosine-type recombinase/integrase n=1 Tax=Pseudonocardia asaccharolytica TaxID=54010 RepID=UPI000422EF31|nr:tyrosine-type recombinase/integrase [Pseudonocardia asaccharolytica]